MVTYLLSISCNNKKIDINQDQLNEIIYHLKQCGVIFYYAVHEKHGRYNQLHTHSIAKYTGQYKNLTKYGNREVEGFDYKIHFTPITSYVGAMNYLEKIPNHIVAESI